MSRRFPRALVVHASVLALLACSTTDSPLTPVRVSPALVQSGSEGLQGAIAFHSTRAGNFHVFVMNADGSNVRQLTGGDGFFEFDPIWSPNGQQLTFGRFDAAFTFNQVVVINDDGSGERVIAENAFPGAWSPNGKQIAINMFADGAMYVINADESGMPTKVI